MRALLWALLSATLALSGITPAAADDVKSQVRQPGKADALFTLGKERLAADDYSAACPLLAESYQLDPATGSLLALALCHERQGKLASALREYNEVVVRARAESRPDREQAAQAHIYALTGKLSTLTLKIEERPAELTIRVNDVLVAPEQLGRPLPIDGGFVVIQVEAEGKLPWQKHISIAESDESLTISIPRLEPAPVVAAAPAPAPKPAARPPRKHVRFSGAEVAGLTLLGASAIAAGIAVGYTVHAVKKNHDSDDKCRNDVCTPAGRELRLDARKAGDVATVAVLSATALSAAGLITYLVGRHKNDKRMAGVELRPSAWVAAGSGGATLSGQF